MSSVLFLSLSLLSLGPLLPVFPFSPANMEETPNQLDQGCWLGRSLPVESHRTDHPP